MSELRSELARAIWAAMVDDEPPDNEYLWREGYFDAADAVLRVTEVERLREENVRLRARADEAVADLRLLVDEQAREVERLRETLDGLTHAAREFSTEAAYTVSAQIEAEFIVALGDAERLLASGAVKEETG